MEVRDTKRKEDQNRSWAMLYKNTRRRQKEESRDRRTWRIKGLCKENKIPKIRNYYGSGWVGPGLTRNFFFGKSSQNSSKKVLIFWSSRPCVFCLHCYKLLVIMIWVFFHVNDGFPKRQNLDGGGWVGWPPSNFFGDFWNFLNFAMPLNLKEPTRNMETLGRRRRRVHTLCDTPSYSVVQRWEETRRWPVRASRNSGYVQACVWTAVETSCCRWVGWSDEDPRSLKYPAAANVRVLIICTSQDSTDLESLLKTLNCTRSGISVFQ